MRDHDLAQLNIGRLVAPVDSPVVAEFIDALDEVNALADASPGFRWRFQTEEGNTIAERPFSDDKSMLVNFSTWESVDALADYVFRTGHADFLRRRREWFERLEHLRRHGPTEYAFTLRQRFEPGVVS